MTSHVDSPRRGWWLAALTLFTFFFLLGSRSLNEPDEGRYAEVAREMIELKDWVVPHLWYAPHLGKPPLTYWSVAASMSIFGTNEWAVRLPLALAGISGVWVSFLFGCALGGRRAGIWSALVLQSSLLYFVMARMLTTDMLLSQFVAWAAYCFWRSWRSLEGGKPGDNPNGSNGSPERFWPWHLGGWAAMALGFVAKGPIALAVPLAGVLALVLARRRHLRRAPTLALGTAAGLLLFFLLIVPWFWAAFQRVPGASQFMIFGQAVGHVLGTTIKNRRGPLLYYVPILAVGFLPWTVLLGWLWRRAHWRQLDRPQQDAWVQLSGSVLFTLILFTLSRAKLPAYILPVFPLLAVMTGLRYFGGSSGAGPQPPAWAWRLCLASPLVMGIAIPIVVRLVFHVGGSGMLAAPAVGVALLGVLAWNWRRLRPGPCAAGAVALGLAALHLVSAGAPLVETELKANQTLKPLGLALQRAARPGAKVVCWGRLPQGLPFYAYPVICATNRPYLGGLAPGRVPFESPGNLERFHDWLLPDAAAMVSMLRSDRLVLVVGLSGSFEQFGRQLGDRPLHLLTRVGQWELFSNQ